MYRNNNVHINIMDNIITLKNKHMKITDSQMKELLIKQINPIIHVQNKDLHSNDDEIEINELTSKVTSIKENLQSEKRTLEYKKHELSKHLECIKKLEAEKNKFLEKNQILEIQRNKLRSCKSNLNDQNLLAKGRKKFSLYKELMRIHWDYENLKENVKGYVTNKRDYIHHFSYNSEDSKDLCNLLWEEIHQSTIKKENGDIHNKENISNNTQS